VDISIIVCTHNRSALLQSALTHLVAQTGASVETEIIVVDNNSTDDTAEVVGQIVNAAQMEVRYRFEASQGISFARNSGLAVARGSIVAFTDDDIEVEPDWVARIVAAFAAHPDIDCVGGKVLPAWPAQPPAWLTRDHWPPLAILDYGDAPRTLDRTDPRCLVGANVAFRREAIDRLGGFSPAVQRVKDGIGSIEDHEFLTRLWNAGGRARYVPEIVVMAPVDPARLHKRYHRRWHFGHGHFYALLRAPNIEQSAAGRLFDVPGNLYRQFLIDAVVWLRLILTGHLDRAFANETRMRFFWGFFETRRRQHLHASAGAVARIGALSRGLHRQVRAPVVEALHRADDRFTSLRGLPRHVMFEAANPMLFNVFRPVYARLSADPRIAITLVPYGREFGAAEIFAGASGRDRIVPPRLAAWMKPDVYINTDLWSMTWLHRRTRRVHLFHGVAGKYGLDAPVELAAAVRTFDRILFPNRDRLERYIAAGLVDAGGRVAVLTGYPKVDCLVDGSLDRDAIAARLRLDPTRSTVIYAPTWSEHSSLNTVGEQVMTALTDAGFNVIVKLHACSYTVRGSGGIDWRARLRPLAARPNLRVVDDVDASPYLVVSDLLVTDHSTVGFEFMVLDRPVVVLHEPSLIEHARINPAKVARLQDAARVVHDWRHVCEAVREELRWPERLSGARRQAAHEVFHGYGHATERATAVIYELLQLSARPIGAEVASVAQAG
jgi:glycosyltransferase involved in cell wall biosynthesis